MRDKNIVGKEVAVMSEETLFEKLGVKYIEKDGIFYPLIALCGEKKNTDVGKYGHMWIDYIRTEYPQRYKSLVRFGELHDKAAEVNEVAYELLEQLKMSGCVNINQSSRILLWKCIC